MDSTMLWLLIFAVAVIFLLAVFLAASERELKKSRRELETLASTNNDGTQQNGQLGQEYLGASSHATAELQDKIAELESALATTTSQLEQQQNISHELQAARDSIAATETATEALQRENQQLQIQIAELKNTLSDPNKRQAQAAAETLSSERESQLTNEIAALTEQLQAAKTMEQELSAARAQLEQTTSRENDLRAGQERLQTQLEAKSKELEAEQQNTAHLTKLVADHEQAQSVTAQWQDWANARRQQVNETQQHWQDWLSKQEALQREQLQLGAALSSLQQGMEPPAVGNLTNASGTDQARTSAATAAGNEPAASETRESDTQSATDNGQPTPASNATDDASSSNKRTVGIVAALFFVCVAGVLLAYSFQKKTGNTANMEATAKVPTNIAYRVSLEGPSETLTHSSITTPLNDEDKADAARDAPESKSQIPAPGTRHQRDRSITAKAANTTRMSPKTSQQRLWGLYQTTQPSRVYQGPNENSELIADLPAGVKLNVVSVKNGWLEVRSKHGRPPGFIRQEAAARVEAQR